MLFEHKLLILELAVNHAPLLVFRQFRIFWKISLRRQRKKTGGETTCCFLNPNPFLWYPWPLASSPQKDLKSGAWCVQTPGEEKKANSARLFFSSLLPHSNCPTFSPSSSSAWRLAGRSSFGSDRRLQGAMQRLQKFVNVCVSFFKKNTTLKYCSLP